MRKKVARAREARQTEAQGYIYGGEHQLLLRGPKIHSMSEVSPQFANSRHANRLQEV